MQEVDTGGSAYPIFRYDDIVDAVLARHLITSMERALTIDPDESAKAALARLDEGQFDFAPVINKTVLGRVGRTALRSVGTRTVRDVYEHLGEGLIVSAQLPLANLIREFERTQFLFVLDGSKIAGFVTPSDLNKESARAYFFLMVANLEMALAERIRRTGYSEDGILGELADKRRGEVRERISRQKRADRFVDAVAALDLKDLVHICGRQFETSWVNMTALSAWHDLSQPTDVTGRTEYEVVRLRNDCVHASELLIGRRTVAQLVRLEVALRDVLRELASS